MQIAAILTVPEDPTTRAFAPMSRDSQDGTRSYARSDILGASILERTLLRLKAVRTLPPTVLSDGNISDQLLPSRSAGSNTDAWEKAVSGYVRGGADLLVLVQVGAYADVDYAELLSFHAGTGSPLTQVYDADGSLDITVVNATALRNADDLMSRALSHLMPQHKRFHCSGYVNRLHRPQDLHRLMQDGLHGHCELRPVGNEVQPGVWAGERVDLDATAKIYAPAFMGTGSRIAAGCTIAGASSIERNCHIDCATLIEDSFVLQGTYVGVALDVRRAIVGDKKIFTLDRNVEVRVSDARLVGRSTKPVGLFAGLASLLRSEAQAGD